MVRQVVVGRKMTPNILQRAKIAPRARKCQISGYAGACRRPRLLVQFRVENHRSLRDEQVLSLVAAGDKAEAHVLRPEGLGEALVPVVAIYGANASGKSNVLAALRFMRTAILESHRRWDVEGAPHEPFLLSSKADAPSLYEVDIVMNGVRYRYGFQLSTSRVEEEWLFAWPHGRRATWFEREGDRFEFGKMLHGENEVIRRLTRSNSLFLSAAAQNNHPALRPIFHHFAAWRFSMHRGVYPRRVLSATFARQLVRARVADRNAIVQLLQDADTGIVDVRVDSSEAQLALKLGPDQLDEVHQSSRRPAEVFFRHRATDDDRAWLPLTLESAGTVGLLELAPYVVDTLLSGGLLCVDELEASLHPMLALRIVGMFNDPKQNPSGAQLMFATHDTNLLGSIVGQPALRRDQVWFTEKDDTGATHLYPLTDFHPRKEENLARGYLQGRYGAIPYLGALVDKTGDDLAGRSSGGEKPNGDDGA